VSANEELGEVDRGDLVEGGSSCIAISESHG